MRVILVLLLLLVSAQAHAAPPRRVISLAPSLTEMAFALGAGSQLVGVTSYCNYPPAADKLPEVGALADGSFDFERIVGSRPDLVLALDEGQTQTIETLRRLGLRVEVIPSQTIDDIFTGIPRLGRLLGREPAAQRLHADLKRRLDRIRKATAAIPVSRRPRVFFEVWDEPLMAGTRRSLAGQLIELAGGINIFGDLPGRYVQVSPEAVLKRNPQVLVAPDTHTTTVDRQSLINRPGLSGIDAARTGRILILDGDLISRAGPRIADALEMLVEAIHPGLLKPRKSRAERGTLTPRPPLPHALPPPGRGGATAQKSEIREGGDSPSPGRGECVWERGPGGEGPGEAGSWSASGKLAFP